MARVLDVIRLGGRTGRGTGADEVTESTPLRSDPTNDCCEDGAAGKVRVRIEVGELAIALVT